LAHGKGRSHIAPTAQAKVDQLVEYEEVVLIQEENPYSLLIKKATQQLPRALVHFFFFFFSFILFPLNNLILNFFSLFFLKNTIHLDSVIIWCSVFMFVKENSLTEELNKMVPGISEWYNSLSILPPFKAAVGAAYLHYISFNQDSPKKVHSVSVSESESKILYLEQSVKDLKQIFGIFNFFIFFSKKKNDQKKIKLKLN